MHCMCGDAECWICGVAQGTREGVRESSGRHPNADGKLFRAGPLMGNNLSIEIARVPHCGACIPLHEDTTPAELAEFVADLNEYAADWPRDEIAEHDKAAVRSALHGVIVIGAAAALTLAKYAPGL